MYSGRRVLCDRVHLYVVLNDELFLYSKYYALAIRQIIISALTPRQFGP